jgi:hypothetical protein
LSVLLRYTDSDYPFVIFKLFLSFCTFSFGHCVVSSSSIYGFWLPLWHHQTLLGTLHCRKWWKNISALKYYILCTAGWNN